MKHLIAFMVLACVSCSPVPAVAIELTGEDVTLSAADRATLARCAAQNGCIVATRDGIKALMLKAVEITLEEVAKDPPICKKELSI